MGGRSAKPGEQRQSKKEQAKGRAPKREIQEEAKPRTLFVETVDLNLEALKKIWKRSRPSAVLIVLILFIFFTGGYFAVGYYAIHLVPLKNEKINELRDKNKSLEIEMAPYRVLTTKFPEEIKALQEKTTKELKTQNDKIEKQNERIAGCEEKTQEFEERLSALEKTERDRLNAYKLFGAYGQCIIPSPAAKDFNLNIDWNETHVRILPNNTLEATIPSLVFILANGSHIQFHGLKVTLRNQPGAQLNLVRSGDQVLVFRIIARDENFITLALGVEQVKS